MKQQYSLLLLRLLPHLLWLLCHAARAGHISIQPRIIGGWDVPQGRYPYMVSLLDEQGLHECGGSLIAPDVVLTAAHCRNKVVTALVGRYNRSDPLEEFDTFQIVARYVHPRYDPATYPFDFMLLKLSGSSTRQVISLNHNDSAPTDGQELTVMGFGLTQPGNASSVPLVLQQVTVNVISNTICGQAQQRGVSQNYIGQITSDMLCADGSQRDSCQGDSGGPLIVPGDSPDQDVQVGHASWGLGCAISAFPGVYSRTSYGYAWIASVLCVISSNPPSEFLCQDDTRTFSPAPSRYPTTSPAPTGPLVSATVIIYLDDSPYDTGWCIEDASTGISVIEVQTGTYNISEQTVVETVQLHGGRQYRFVIKDSYGDGILSDGYRIVLGSSEFGTSVLLRGSGSFLFQSEQDFLVPTSYPPTVTNSSGLTPSPSPASTLGEVLSPTSAQEGSVFLTIEIQLDQHPEQTSWRLDSLGASLTELARAPSGSYATPFQLVQQSLELKAGRTYLFTMFDEAQNGIDNGHVKLYLGPSDTSSATILALDHTGDFGPSLQFTFDASSSNSVNMPTTRPLGSSFLTLELRFDLYPNEISIIIEANDYGKLYFLLYRPHGYYTNEEHANHIVYEYVVLPQGLSNSTFYTFAITDTYSDGLCCSHNGKLPYTTGYTLYDGSEADGKVLVLSRFRSAPKEELRFSLPMSHDHSELTAPPFTGSHTVQVTIAIEDDPGLVGYYIQDVFGSRVVNREPGTFSRPVVDESIPLNEGVYYFGLVDSSGGGFNGTYQVQLATQGYSDRPPILSGSSQREALHQAFLVEGFGSSFPVAVVIETDSDPNHTGFYMERLDLNVTNVRVAQVPAGSYNYSHVVHHELVMVEPGGLYRLVLEDGDADGMNGRISIVVGGTDRNSDAAREVTIYGTSYESRGYYTFLAQKNEPASATSLSNSRNLTLQMQFDVLPMGVDWVVLSDSPSALAGSVSSQSRSLQGPSLIAYGPQTPSIVNVEGRQVVETIALPFLQQQGLQQQPTAITYTLSISFRVNELCCPNGLSGSYELYDADDTSSSTPLLLSRGHFSNANQAVTGFTLSSLSSPSRTHSAATGFTQQQRRRQRIYWLITAALLVWPMINAISGS